MKLFKVQVSTHNGQQVMWSAVMADNLHYAYELAYSQFGRANVMFVTEA